MKTKRCWCCEKKKIHGKQDRHTYRMCPIKDVYICDVCCEFDLDALEFLNAKGNKLKEPLDAPFRNLCIFYGCKYLFLDNDIV